MPKVTVIPATIGRITHLPKASVQKRRVAAYARVSTDSEEQLTSYEAQVDYYTRYIKSREEWEFVSIYTDEGITATNTKHRDGFNQMVDDALDGKIDLIVTKSVSRFARNTVDSLTTVRKLKEKGVEIYFEKEGIYTFDSKGELLITIMSSLAQEESRSISENVTWGQRKRMADGKVSLPYGQFLGYRKGENGLPEIVPEEAEIVKNIYRWFMQGMTPGKIANELMKLHIPSPSGKEKWYGTTVKSILMNEKYKGSAILQKSFTVDFLTKKKKINEGEVPQYVVENSHPAIISPEEYELVQAEIMMRQEHGIGYSGSSPFSSKIVCSCCNGYYGPKVWHSTSKYRRTVWQCNQKFKKKCTTPHLYEDTIKIKFINACKKAVKNRDKFIDSCKQISEVLSDCTAIDKKQAEAEQEFQDVQAVLSGLICENAMVLQDQTEFRKRCEPYETRLEEIKNEISALKLKREKRISRKGVLEIMLQKIDDVLMDSFDVDCFIMLIEKATVQENGSVVFHFINGMEVTE